MAQFTRRQYFIDKNLQTRYIILMVVVLIVHTFIVLAAVFSPYILMLSFDYPLDTRAEAAKAFLLVHGNAWPVIGGFIIFVGILTLFVTHRIAGPIFRIKRGIRDLADGRLNETIHLRKKDEFHDVAEELNTLAARFRESFSLLKEKNSLLAGSIDELEREIRDKKLDETVGRHIIRNIQESREAIQAILDRFHV
jgi:methyl-accepting chemotaxis protein